MRETDLYEPVKAFLEGQGYEVKAEVRDCDVVAVRGDEDPVVVELKLQLSLALLMQGVDRQAITDAVYVAVPAGKTARWRGQVKDAVRLCRRLGLGLMSIRNGTVLVHVDPGPYAPRKMRRRRELLLKEFQNRVGDPNTGGQSKRKIITAYRQDALRLALHLSVAGTVKPAVARKELGVVKAAAILQSDHYGWFERVERGVYSLRPNGVEALETYADVVALLKA
ncbi:DUF2161 domain-containing phosphodiesterase [Neptunicoccus cionae]|uniref:DUF2161 domain-containing phosphodiesterase n=1 Tax=Neptunicoccus cionae TaxID=2035344 RepID=UPI000C783BFF|nr:DUF2161 family putative PD-(D/E)XK-type phosphodiesterase [Amylibacter cionae]PLS21871.1 hypothetical protein C0U40_10355 [Amylibacter cionae]